MDDVAWEGVPWRADPGGGGRGFLALVSRSPSILVRIAFEAWPAILAERGASDPARPTAR